MRWPLTILVLINITLLIFPAQALLKPIEDQWHTSGQVTITIQNHTGSPILVTPIGVSDNGRTVPVLFYGTIGLPGIVPERRRFEIAAGQARELIYNWWNCRARWIVVESGQRIGQLEVDQTQRAMTVDVRSLDDLQRLEEDVKRAHAQASEPYSVTHRSGIFLWLPLVTLLPLFIYTLVLWSRATNPVRRADAPA